MTVRNLNWELEATFNRKEIVQMAILAEYVSNIETALTKDFDSCKKIDWSVIRNVMNKFAQLGAQDTLAYRGLCQMVQNINDNKMMILSGKVVEKETP